VSDEGAGRAHEASRIGASVRRVEDFRLVTGRGRYADDLAAPGTLHALFLRSPHAHARILAIDVAAAISASAVAVFTGDDLAAARVSAVPNPPQSAGGGFGSIDARLQPNPPWFPLARGRVRHVGEAVALVVAETLEAARDAAELVTVQYAPLPAVTDVPAATAVDAPLVWDELPGNRLFELSAGDAAATEAAFRRAAHVVELKAVNNRLAINFLEPRACVASFDAAGDRIELHIGSAGVHLQAERIAEALGVAREAIRVTTGDVGGGFGARNTTYPEYVACAHAARALKRTVKWRAERSEAFLSDTQARDHVARGALALDDKGRILALRVDAHCNLGAHLGPRQPGAIIGNVVRLLTGTYAIPAAHLAFRGFVTHTVPVNVYRGVGRIEDAYLLERLIDRAAAQLGIDRVELRRRNLVPRTAMPFRTATGAVYDSGDFPATLEGALAAADWSGFAARRQAARARGRLRGIGIACILEGAGGVAEEYAAVSVAADGSVELKVGAQSQGQGHETTLAQVAAELLQVGHERVRVVAGDTDRVREGVGTFASRSMMRAGTASLEAGQALLDLAKERASERLETAAADLVYAGGKFTVAGTDRSVALEALAKEAPLAAEARHSNEAIAYPNGTHVCEVEVDPETGRIEILRYVAVDDVGRAVNPMIVHGQTMGGVAQGLGQALLERCVFDRETGQPLSASFMDYALPRADDLPPFESLLADVPSPSNPLGVKGAGESGTVAAPCAAIGAVLDALAPLGVTEIEMPATPERVWLAIKEALRRGASPALGQARSREG
jgi:carbon-monoxide dehydrogenase large subunit